MTRTVHRREGRVTVYMRTILLLMVVCGCQPAFMPWFRYPVLQLSGQMYSGYSVACSSSRPASIPAEFSWCAHNTYPEESQICYSPYIIKRKKVRTIRWAGCVDGGRQGTIHGSSLIYYGNIRRVDACVDEGIILRCKPRLCPGHESVRKSGSLALLSYMVVSG